MWDVAAGQPRRSESCTSGVINTGMIFKAMVRLPRSQAGTLGLDLSLVFWLWRPGEGEKPESWERR